VNAAPSGSADGGTLVKRYQLQNNTGAGDVVADIPKVTGTAQTGSTSTTIVLATGASATDNFYNGWWLSITSGTGVLQVRRIKSYVGATKVATIYSTADESATPNTPPQGANFTTTPDATSVYALFDTANASMYFSAGNREWVTGYTVSGPGATPVSTLDYANMHSNNLTLEGSANVKSATASTTTATGAMTIAGGIGVIGQVTAGNMVTTGTIISGSHTITGTVSATGVANFTSGTASTTTGTGALLVTGGAGITGQVTAGNIVTAGTFASGATTITGTLSTSGVTTLTSGTASTTTATGSLVITGGAGISGQVTAGNIVTAGTLASGSTTITGTISATGIASFTSGTASTTTGTGALLVSGGAGVTGQVTAGNFSTAGTLVAGATTITGTLSATGVTSLTNATASTTTGTGGLVLSGGLGVVGQVTAGNVSTTGTLIAGVTTITGTISATGIASFTSGTASTTTGTGALLVTGGAGITGQITAGNISTAGTLTSGNTTITGTLTASGVTNLTNATASTTTATGALTISGGLGVAGQITSGSESTGTFTASGVVTLTNATASTTTATGALLVSGGVGVSGQITTGTLSSGNTSITSATVSSSQTTGALVVSGGLGVGGSIQAGNVFSNGVLLGASTYTAGTNISITSNVISVITNPSFSGIGSFTSGTASTTTTTGSLLVTGGVGITGQVTAGNVSTSGTLTAGNTTITGTISANGIASFTSGTASTTTATGAVVITGGLGLSGQVTAGNISTAGTLSSGATTVTGTLSVTGVTTLTSATASTTTATGALVITGGLGVAGQITSGNESTGALNASGSVTFTKGTASTSSLTGSLVVTGGIGLSGGLNAGSNSNITVAGTVTQSALTVFVPSLSVGNNVNQLLGASASNGNCGYTNFIYQGINSTTSTMQLGIYGTTNSAIMIQNTNSTSSFVGINTASPAYQLDISGTARATGILTLSSGTASTTTATGSLVVTGGIGLTGQITAGNVSTAGTLAAGNTTITGTLGVGGITTITNATASTASSNGALVVSGGVGIAGALNVGSTSTISIGGTTGATILNLFQPGITFNSGYSVNILLGKAGSFYNTALIDFVYAGGLGSTSNYLALGLYGAPQVTIDGNGITTVTGTTASTSTNTGALVVSGGVGIAGAMNSATLQVTGDSALAGNLGVGGQVQLVNTTASTSTTSGALIVTGGIGVAGTLYANSIISYTSLETLGSAAITQDLTVQQRVISMGGQGVRIANLTAGGESSIQFASNPTFVEGTTTNTSWVVGQNVNSIGSGYFGIYNTNSGSVLTMDYFGNTTLTGNVTLGKTASDYYVQTTGQLHISANNQGRTDVNYVNLLLNAGNTSNSSSNIALSVGGESNRRMIITSSGSVGIGLNYSPSAGNLLDVNGTLGVTISGSNGNAFQYLFQPSLSVGANSATFIGMGGSTGGCGYINFTNSGVASTNSMNLGMFGGVTNLSLNASTTTVNSYFVVSGNPTSGSNGHIIDTDGTGVGPRARALTINYTPQSTSWTVNTDPGDATRGLAICSNTANRPIVFTMRNLSQSNPLRFWDIINEGGGNTRLLFQAYNNGTPVTPLTLDPTANCVGINTTSPTFPLTITGNRCELFASGNGTEARYGCYNNGGQIEWVWGQPTGDNNFVLNSRNNGSEGNAFYVNNYAGGFPQVNFSNQTNFSSGQLFSSASAFSLIANSGAVFKFFLGSTTAFQIAGSGSLGSSIFLNLPCQTQALIPASNGGFDIGTASFRYTNIFLVNTPNVSSARDLKTRIEPIQSATNLVKTLEPKMYQLKSDLGLTHFGFIADEAQTSIQQTMQNKEYAVLPKDPDTNTVRSLLYGELTPVLWQAVREILDENDSLKSRVDQLEEKLNFVLSKLE